MAAKENLVRFYPIKAQVCAFTGKKDPYVMVPQFQGVPCSTVRFQHFFYLSITVRRGTIGDRQPNDDGESHTGNH